MPDSQQDPENLQNALRRRIGEHLSIIYPGQPTEALTERLVAEIGMGRNLQAPEPYSNNWDESDCILITYGNTIQNHAERPLRTLRRFIDNNLRDVISTVCVFRRT